MEGLASDLEVFICKLVAVFCFFFFKQKTAYEITTWLEFRRVLFRSGSQGIVLETDEYFYAEVGKDPASYDYSKELLPIARQWNFARFREAIA